MPGLISLFAGSASTDQTGTPGRTVGLALISMFNDLFAPVQPTIVLAAGTYNDLNPGSSFPVAGGCVDISVTSGIAIVTGLLAGYKGQRIRVRQIGAGTLQLPYSNAGSAAANQWLGPPGSLSLSQGQSHDFVYYTTPATGWQQ